MEKQKQLDLHRHADTLEKFYSRVLNAPQKQDPEKIEFPQTEILARRMDVGQVNNLNSTLSININNIGKPRKEHPHTRELLEEFYGLTNIVGHNFPRAAALLSAACTGNATPDQIFRVKKYLDSNLQYYGFRKYQKSQRGKISPIKSGGNYRILNKKLDENGMFYKHRYRLHTLYTILETMAKRHSLERVSPMRVMTDIEDEMLAEIYNDKKKSK